MAVLPELRNGETTPDSGSAPSTPDADQQHLAGDQAGQSQRQEESVMRVGALARRATPRQTRNAEQQKHRGHAREAPLFADGRQHQVGVARRDHSGSPHPGPEPEGPPVEKAQSACAS